MYDIMKGELFKMLSLEQYQIIENELLKESAKEL